MDRERLVDLAIALALTAWMLAEVWAEQLAPPGWRRSASSWRAPL